ncbi:Damage-regulated import facilitator 1 [Candida viswanathii]|uniref:Damage-regulated import facilitator 1 n=1 Tax=Candida viswanathii TaxID=5486 RepID=A0A367XYY1_9ASCO|nr:Damage-regulated import facilitator 1 [Candida viswanathii]
MSQQRIKRQMQTAIQPAAPMNPDVAALPSVAMRIRKAVSEGYQLPTNNSQQQQFQRVPLPNNMTTPPELIDSYSTRTTSNLEEWDSYYKIQNAPVQTLPGTNYLKRKFDDEKSVELSQYQARYGELRFNEEF